MQEIKLSDWEKLGIPEETVNQLHQAGVDCTEAFRQFSRAFKKCEPLRAEDFPIIPPLRELKPSKIVGPKQPNFARFQNNFKRNRR